MTIRFCARWRREMPTVRYGEDFLMLDADGPRQLLGFVYGVACSMTWTAGATEAPRTSTSTASVEDLCQMSYTFMGIPVFFWRGVSQYGL